MARLLFFSSLAVFFLRSADFQPALCPSSSWVPTASLLSLRPPCLCDLCVKSFSLPFRNFKSAIPSFSSNLEPSTPNFHFSLTSRPKSATLLCLGTWQNSPLSFALAWEPVLSSLVFFGQLAPGGTIGCGSSSCPSGTPVVAGHRFLGALFGL